MDAIYKRRFGDIYVRGLTSNILLMEIQPSQRSSQRSSMSDLLPKRPRGKYQTHFRSLNVVSNHFPVKVEGFSVIYIFSVHFNPKIPLDNTILRRRLLDENRQKIKAYIEQPVISGNNIYSTVKPLAEVFEIDTGEHKINAKQVKILDLQENPSLLLSFLNNGLRSVMRGLDYMEIGRSGKYFNAKQKTHIDNLMMFSGYKSNFVHLQSGYYLRVDSAKKIVRNQSVLDVIDSIYKVHRDKDREERRNLLLSELIGKIVMTNYGKTAYYRIEDVVFEDIDSIRLEDASISIREYYEQKYKLKITNSKQPLLKVESRRKNKEFQILLIPEFCLMTGIPENFDEFRRKKISENTIKQPDVKQKQIMNLMTELRGNSEFGSLKELGIRVSKNLETVKGRLIPMPRINLGDNNNIEEGKQAFFQLHSKPIFASKHSIRCGIVYFSGQDVRQLLDTFEETSKRLKVKFEAVKIKAGEYDNRKGKEMMEHAIGKAAEREGCNICLIVLPTQMKTQYKRLKNTALVKHKVICQMTTENTLRKNNLRSIATKILLQIIAKRGNTLWVPKCPKQVSQSMLLAFETVKAGKITTLGMCATLNAAFSSIFSRTETFEAMDKKFSTMLSMTLNAVEAYAHRNKKPAEELVIFHSSTSNDQVRLFQEFYTNPLKEKMAEIYHEKAPLITMVMVNLKTSERFFTEGNSVRNAPAGTVVASDVVSNNYDFYVISQNSNRGSVVPNHYKVIHTDSKLEEGVLQELIFSQCFNYVNWTGSIKVPGILQYADKCAKFNSEILENEKLCEELQNKLYFV